MLKISKRSATLLAMFCLGVAGLQAQEPTPTPSSSNTQASEKRINYVRRLSFGVGLSVIALDTINNGTLQRATTTPPPPTAGNYATTVQRKRVGYTGMLQILVTNRFAFTAGIVMRNIAFQRNGEVLSGTDNPTTAIDDRRFSTIFEDTRARFYDIPLTIRYFGKDKTRAGGRWFVEGGIVQRNVSNLKSSVFTTLGDTEVNCCNPTTATNGVRGAIAGFGGQLIDPFGIRVMPSVRYTRWMGETFNSFSTVSKKNQIEAMITIGF